MPGIKDVDIFKVHSGKPRGVKDGHGDDKEDNSLCQSCLKYGIHSKLKKRMYKVELVAQVVADSATEQTTPKPKLVPASVPDADRFRQCYHCGDIVPIYNVKYESKIEDFVQTIDNPFDTNPGNMEGFTPGRDRLKLNKSKSIYKRKKDYIASIKDNDVRRELADGQTQLALFTES